MEKFDISDKLLDAVKGFEGCRLTSYKCPAGVWTIGAGHTRGVRPGQKITQQQADMLLKGDLLPCENYVNSLGVCRTQGQFDALVDFAFNVGIGALSKSTLLRLIRAGAPAEDIAEQFRKWVYAKGKKLSGLEKRREWEVQRWME